MSKYNVRDKKEFRIWERDCDMDVLFDCYEGEEIDTIQIRAYEDFLSDSSTYFETAKNEIVNFIKKEESIDVDNIFKYAVPKMIYIQKDPKKRRVIGILFHYRFDQENGLAVKYVDGKVSEIGAEDIIL